jgi:ribosome maturation factor RimP
MAQQNSSQRESLAARIASLAEESAAEIGLEIVHVEITGTNRAILRVFIDKPGGVGLEDCERFSRRFSIQLDVEDWIPFSYVLEVSSPGLDRPLVKERDFRRFAGRRATVRTRGPIHGQRNFKGVILGSEQGTLFFEVDRERRIEIALEEVEKANLVADLEGDGK